MANQIKTAVQFCTDALLFAILVLGVFGVFYKLLGPNGWIGTIGSKLWKGSPAVAVGGILLAAGVVYWIKRRLDDSAGRGGAWDKLVYAWIGIGAYFAVRLAITGHL